MKLKVNYILALIVIATACTSKKPADYSAYITEMSAVSQDYTCINQAKDIFIKYAAEQDSTFVDSAFAIFYNTMITSELNLGNLTENEEGLPDYMAAVAGAPIESYSNEKAMTVKEKLHAGNIISKSEEGDIYFSYDLMVSAEQIKPLLSKSMQEFFDLIITERQSPPVQDGAIIIPMLDFADYVISWDAQKTAPLRLVKKEYATQYLHILMTGVDNTPFINEEGMVNQPYLEAYQYLMDRYKSSYVGSIARTYISILAKNEFVPNEESEEFVRATFK
ncbi:MAG: hypothetical protein Q7J34_08850 [Bacteroidales bacterium]|nr:hypothetical protein [Bacteroidales bacterium]